MPLNPTKIRSISQVGTTEPFYLQVARNQIFLHENIFKFGFNPDVDDALETVWGTRWFIIVTCLRLQF